MSIGAVVATKGMYWMNIICFGDSNTYGYDPRGYFGGRYDGDSRWVDILASETGWTVSNMGENGRSPEQAAEKLNRFLSGISLDRNKILLIAPPPVQLGAWVPNQQLIADSHTFAQLCQTLAERLGIRFADAGKWDITLAYDGVHFTEQGHRTFAAGLLEELK